MKPFDPMPPMKPMAPMKSWDAPASDWWPEGLSEPSSTGAQGSMRYAFFPKQRRLAIERQGTVEQYDTGDHVVQGVSQSGSGASDTVHFSSQHGELDLESLTRVD